MEKPLIIMVHRVEYLQNQVIDEVYYKRNFVAKLDELTEILSLLIKNDFLPGSIEDAVQKKNIFHISFDDGFKEHIEVAKILSKRFDLPYDACSFAINTGNSLTDEYSGMDLIYNIIKNRNLDEICEYLQIRDQNECNLVSIKKKYIQMSYQDIKRMGEEFVVDFSFLRKQFLNENEIVQLSKMYTIASHGVYHRDLTFNLQFSKNEIYESKKKLEDVTGNIIDTFCYPEGKNDETIWQFCEDSGYKFALSIGHSPNNPYRIGRYCINREIEQIRHSVVS